MKIKNDEDNEWRKMKYNMINRFILNLGNKSFVAFLNFSLL